MDAIWDAAYCQAKNLMKKYVMKRASVPEINQEESVRSVNNKNEKDRWIEELEVKNEKNENSTMTSGFRKNERKVKYTKKEN